MHTRIYVSCFKSISFFFSVTYLKCYLNWNYNLKPFHFDKFIPCSLSGYKVTMKVKQYIVWIMNFILRYSKYLQWIIPVSTIFRNDENILINFKYNTWKIYLKYIKLPNRIFQSKSLKFLQIRSINEQSNKWFSSNFFRSNRKKVIKFLLKTHGTQMKPLQFHDRFHVGVVMTMQERMQNRWQRFLLPFTWHFLSTKRFD